MEGQTGDRTDGHRHSDVWETIIRFRTYGVKRKRGKCIT